MSCANEPVVEIMAFTFAFYAFIYPAMSELLIDFACTSADDSCSCQAHQLPTLYGVAVHGFQYRIDAGCCVFWVVDIAAVHQVISWNSVCRDVVVGDGFQVDLEKFFCRIFHPGAVGVKPHSVGAEREGANVAESVPNDRFISAVRFEAISALPWVIVSFSNAGLSEGVSSACIATAPMRNQVIPNRTSQPGALSSPDRGVSFRSSSVLLFMSRLRGSDWVRHDYSFSTANSPQYL